VAKLPGMTKDDDLFRPLSEQEQDMVERDVDEQRAYGEAAIDAAPDSPVNAGDVSGLDLPLSAGEREIAQHDLDAAKESNEDELPRT
jgi:hypothetical protein